MLSAKSWMPDSRTFSSNTAAARSEAIAAAPANCRSLIELGAAGRVVGGDHFDARQAPEVFVALGQGLRVRVDGLDLVDRRARQRDQAVDHPEFEVADDLERVLEQEVVIAVDGAADGVLDRQDAEGGGAGLDGAEHVFEARTGQQRGVWGESLRRCLTVGPRFALERHHHALPWCVAVDPKSKLYSLGNHALHLLDEPRSASSTA